MHSKSNSVWRALQAGVLLSVACTLHADPNDPPTRVARLAYLSGGVGFRPAGAEEWVEPGLNRPLTIGDELWSDRDGRMELQLDGSNLRLGTETSASILNLSDQNTQIQLSGGTLIVHVRELADDETYEIDTPNVAFSILRAGTYRLSVAADGASTAIAVRSGQGEAVGGGGTGYTVRSGESDTFTGSDQVEADTAPLGATDEFDAWCAERDNRFDHSQSAQFVSPDVVGYEELDSQGSWNDTPDYGHVWFPTVEAGWAPYHVGHWAYVAPWGYTWVDERPWGFAPFHYGRWVYWQQRWGWVPAPPPAPRTVYVRPVYAPALVAWVGAGATVAWFALAPREVYVPSYPVSRHYLDVVNVSNTRVNNTVITNIYNTTVINRTTVNNITYANRQVPGAIMATDSQAFASARPLRREGGVDARIAAGAPVRAFAPAVVPTRAAVLGGRAAADVRPPQAVQGRVTAARMAPAAAPPSIDARLQSLRNSGGRAVQPAASASGGAAPPRAPAVRVVPPVHTLVSSRDFETARPPAPATPPSAPAGGRPPVHASDLPAGPRAPSPAGANSVLERQQSQEQQQLQARQDAERARLQQQQDQQHRRASDQQANEQRRQLSEQQQQVQAQARAELARRQQLNQQSPPRAPAEQQAQADHQRQLEQQAQQQHASQLAQQQAQQRAEQEQQARSQQQAQAQAEQQRQVQAQRQQQALEAQRQQLEQQHQQQTQQLQQQQTRAREDMQQRQQAAQRQQEPQHRQSPPPSTATPHQPR